MRDAPPADGPADTPIARLLGRSLEHSDPAGAARLNFKGEPMFCNAAGVIQGGILTAMLDSALGQALRAALGPDERFVTLEVSTRFLRPARPGRIVAEARVIRRGRSTAVIQAEIWSPEGDLLAVATSTKLILANAPTATQSD